MNYTEEIIVLMPKVGLNKSDQILHCTSDFKYDKHTVFFIPVESSAQVNETTGCCEEKKTFIKYSLTENGAILINKVVYNGLDLLNVKKIVLFYDINEFKYHNYEDSKCIFTQLNYALSPRTRINSSKTKSNSHFLSLLYILLHWVNATWPVLQYSSVGVQVKATIARMLWAFSSINNEQGLLRIKAFNFLISLIVDIALGIFLLKSLLSVTSSEDFPGLFLWVSENCVDYFRKLLQWLAGSPAGFKLNRNLNNILAQFFMFHTEIWWLFLVYVSPALTVAFHIFTFLGLLGVTIQAAILSDILALVSFHVYCIYAYAARLYNIQLAGLLSLCRLFLGRKWNPLREKVDSCQYTTDQLFVGTLAFTILLFLLPTTLIYYAVFLTTRVLIVAIGGFLSRLQVYLHALPLYSAILWCVNSTAIRSSIRIELMNDKCSKDVIAINCRKVKKPFIATMKNSIPDCIKVPTNVPDGILQKILTGQLLYPV